MFFKINNNKYNTTKAVLTKLSSEKIELITMILAKFNLDIKNTVLIDDRFTGDLSTLSEEMSELLNMGLTFKSLGEYIGNNTLDYRNTIILYINRIPENLLENILEVHKSAFCNILVGDSEVLSPEHNNYQFKYYNLRSMIVGDNMFARSYPKDIVSLLNKTKKRKYKLINTEDLIVNYKTVTFNLVDNFNIHDFKSENIVTTVDNVTNFNSLRRLEYQNIDNILPHENDTYFTDMPFMVGNCYVPIGSKLVVREIPLDELFMHTYGMTKSTIKLRVDIQVLGGYYFRDITLQNVVIDVSMEHLSRFYSMSFFTNMIGYMSNDTNMSEHAINIMPSYCIPCYFSKYVTLLNSDVVYSEETFTNPFFTASSYYELLQGSYGPVNIYYKNYNYDTIV